MPNCPNSFLHKSDTRTLMLLIAKLVLIVSLPFLVASMAPAVQAAYNATQPIVINPDGSITPVDAPITTIDNITYILTDNIIATGDAIVINRSSIVLDGAGWSIIGPQGTGTGILILDGLSNVTIKNLEIRNFYEGIRIDANVNHTLIQNVTFNQSDTGIRKRYTYGLDASGLTVQDSLFLSNNVGIRVLYVNGVSISNNMFTNISSIGIYMSSVKNIVIDANNFVSFPNNGAAAISQPWGSVWNLTITSNVIEDVSIAISLYRVTDNNNLISGNIIANVNDTAMDIYGPQIGEGQLTVRDNVIQDVGIGIKLGGSNLFLTNNTVTNATHALLITDILIASNDNKRHIIIDQTNSFEGHPVYYIVNQSTVQLSNLVAYSVVVVGANQVELSNIQITGDGDVGLGITDSTNVLVNNLSINTTGYGIYLRNVSQASFAQNTITKLPESAPNIADYVGIRPSSSNNIVISNNIIRNFEVGIGPSSTSNLTIENNIIENGYKGIYTDRSIYGYNSGVEILGNIIRNMTGMGITADIGVTRIEGNTLYNIRAQGDGPWAIVDYVSWVYNTIVIKNNIIYDSDRGIYTGGQGPRNALLENNIIYNIYDYGAISDTATYGIYVAGQDVVVRNNTLENIIGYSPYSNPGDIRWSRGYAIYVTTNTNQTIDSNRVSNSTWGLYIKAEANNPSTRFIDNLLENNTYNIHHDITQNTLSSYIYGIEFLGNNTANGDRIFFLVNQSNITITGRAGLVFLYDVTNVSLVNLTLVNASVLKPIWIINADTLRLENVTVDFEGYDPKSEVIEGLISLFNANNTLMTNTFVRGNSIQVDRYETGVYIWLSQNVTLDNVTIKDTRAGVMLDRVDGGLLSWVNATSALYSLYMNPGTSNIRVTLSNFTSDGTAVHLSGVSWSLVENITFTNNTFQGALDLNAVFLSNSTFRFNAFLGTTPFYLFNPMVVFTENSFANTNKPPYENAVEITLGAVYFDSNGKGNYWQGYTATDSDGDGIYDSPLLVQYPTDSGGLGVEIYDYFPLVEPPVPVPSPTVPPPSTVNIPSIDVFPTTVDFGDINVDETAQSYIIVTNSGNGTLNIMDITITGGAGAFSANLTEPIDIAPGSSITITVSFTPLEPGTYTASLTIVSNDPDKPTISISITATGIDITEAQPPVINQSVIETFVEIEKGKAEGVAIIQELLQETTGVSTNVTFRQIRELSITELLAETEVTPATVDLDVNGDGVVDVLDTVEELVNYGVFRTSPPKLDRNVAEQLLDTLKRLYGENLEEFPTPDGKLWIIAVYKNSE